MGDDADGRIVPLDVEPPPAEPPPRVRHSALYSMSLAGMALAALVGIGSMMTFIAVRWPGDTGRYVVGVFLVAIVVFLVSAATALFTAARETYAPREQPPGNDAH